MLELSAARSLQCGSLGLAGSRHTANAQCEAIRAATESNERAPFEMLARQSAQANFDEHNLGRYRS